MGEISNYGQSKSFSVIDIPESEWILELEDIEKDSGRLIQRLTKNQRNISGTRHRFEKGEVLYSKLRTYLNKAFVASEGGYCSSEIVPIRCYSIEPKYLLSVLRSKYYLDYTASLGYGVKMPRLGTNDALVSYIPIPPLNEQKRIIVEIEKWNTILSTIERHKFDLLCTIKSIKSRILDLALSGKLVPQDPDDEPAIELLKRINPDFKPCDSSHYPNLPKGWSICCLADILDYEQPQKYIVESTDYSAENEMPVLTAGKSFIVGYTNETKGICDNLPVIIFDDFTTDSKYVDFPFKVKSSAMKILRSKGDMEIKYIAYFMSITRLVRDTHKRYWISEYSKILMPIPPLREQQRIIATVSNIWGRLNAITAEL